MLLDLIALLCTGLFAGAALYVTLVEHPARLRCGPALAIAEFGPSYRRGAVILPTNKRLLDPALDSGSAEAATLLARWGHLHAVRTLLGGGALLLLGLHL